MVSLSQQQSFSPSECLCVLGLEAPWVDSTTSHAWQTCGGLRARPMRLKLRGEAMQFAGLSCADASNMPVPKRLWVPAFSWVLTKGSTACSFHNVTLTMSGEWLEPIPRSNFFVVQNWYLHCSLVNLTTMTGKLIYSLLNT